MSLTGERIGKAMGAVGFGCVSGFAHLTALLPFWALYGIADVIYVLLYYVARYRRKMVRRNLTACFPHKSQQELKAIERQFYRNFADYIVETIKLLHISDREIKRRMQFGNIEILQQLLDRKRSVVAYFAHTFNWEWAPSVTLHCPRQIERGDVMCQIYRPLRNERFDKLMLKIRSRFGSVSVPKALALRKLLEYRREGVTTVTGFMSDQKPSHGDAIHIVDFLNRPTAVITGTETLARRMGMAAIYWDTVKLSRGHYRIDIKLMAEDASKTAEYELTDRYFKLLEETIRRNPAIWLWSHNRWKKFKV